MSFGDKLSIFSDKAYRKGNKHFEAVGNVVIISGKDTVYGELASLDQETMMAKIEGNVRLIRQDMTLYGSHLEYNIAAGTAVVRNARIITSQFNLVANRLVRVNEKEYIAYDAEFTTCKDCAESWSVYGKVIRVQVNKSVQITKGLTRIKGANVLYIPYIELPMTKRKSGLLFPNISQRPGEGMSFQAPVFLAFDDSKDATISPSSWAKRGFGTDLEYRQRFRDLSWFAFNTRLLSDDLYEPGKTNVTPTGDHFFRHFTDLETHQQFTPNLGSHVRFTDARDLDVIRDHFQYTDPRVNSSDLGLKGHVNYRRDWISMGANAEYLRNMLVEDPLMFDKSYVQTVPRVDLSTMPYTLVQTKTPGINHISVGLDGSYTRFRQVNNNDRPDFLRNADRLSTQPYLLWNFFTWGPVSFKSRYVFDQQAYDFEDPHQPTAGKNAGLLRSEVSFTMDRIFGLAYEEKVPVKEISESELKRLREKKEQGLAPIQTQPKDDRLVGDLPDFQSELAKDTIIQVRNSYRHSQEFKFVHHYIASQNTYGNSTFINQINGKQAGWFDYEDAIRSQEYLFGSNVTRTIIPPQNTVEFQWNNTLIRKSPKTFSFLQDDKYLRDNFTYSKTGYFNVSQGYLLNDDNSDDIRDKLTRLMIESGYSAQRWNISAQEFYFHKQQENIFNLTFNRRFNYVNIMSAYRYASAQKQTPGSTPTNTLSFGTQVRPTDTLGLAMVKGIDFEANREVKTVYSADIMPHNNCWILNLNYQQSLNGSRYSFNVIFNFGQAGFEKYRNDYFSVQRL